jgi:transposase
MRTSHTETGKIEHRIYRYYCRVCDKIVEAPVTDALPNSTIGVRTLVFTAWLHYGLGIATTQITRILNATAQFNVTASGLFQAWYRLAEILKAVYNDIGRYRPTFDHSQEIENVQHFKQILCKSQD